MKKLWTGLLAMALTFSLCAATALAAEVRYPNCSGRNCSAEGVGTYYVDEDGDGVCDNFASGVCGGGYGCGAGQQGGLRCGTRLRDFSCQGHFAADGTWAHCADEDGNGVCDICGRTVSIGAGFIDEDGDGICDNLATGSCGGGYGNGTGRQRGHHGGRRS